MSWEGREPLATPADRFATNRAYGLSAYTMGSMFLIQLRGMMGQPDFDRGMALYYDRWKFKHPEPEDFIKVMEEVSGLQLRWFLTQWTGQLATTDFSVEECSASGNRMTNVELKQTGALHVPVEVVVTLKTGTQLRYYIPNDAVQGQRRADDRVQPAWPWTQQEYAFVVDIPMAAIQQVVVDPQWTTADGKRDNNTYQVP
jgi:aminopeptidase N